MNSNGYPFEFAGVDSTKTDIYQQDALIYRFKSLKSHHHYVVRIERYIKNLHCVKFFDETDDVVAGRFSKLSATFEPRTIFRTVVEIALDVFRKNRKASFMYIGAADKKDLKDQPTRRYRVYKLYLSDFDLHEWFEPADFENSSMYVLANKEAMPSTEERLDFLREIRGFVGLY